MVVAVALVEPRYHVNVGHVARLMKNFGLGKLYLVNPHYDKEEAVRFSTHGKDLLASARIVTLKQLRRRFDVLIGTTAIPATSRLNILRESLSPVQMARIIHDGKGDKNFCILLGRESSGLNNAELGLCDIVVIIDTKTKYRTLNVAHALAILLYEISRLKPDLPAKRKKKSIDLASKQEIDLLISYVGRVAKVSGYDGHKKPLLESAVKKLVAKSAPTAKDVMLLVSLFRKSMVAIERERKKVNTA